jgi:predicted short-subunit dehydrogenase-like oxidoreductase (DUF2520 family)
MKIVIVGSGNVAGHLAKALHEHHQIVQIWSLQYEHALQLANAVNAAAISNFEQLDLTADLCLIAVKDDAIPSVVQKLADFNGIVAHTAGSVNLNVFENKLSNYGVFYPLQTFSKNKAVDFGTIPVCLEANNAQTLQVLTTIASGISQTVVEINSEKRKILHLAAVFACNFTNHLYALAEQLLNANQLDFKLIEPLIKETAQKVENVSPVSVQTGPAVRHDEKTIKEHEQLLISHPQLLEIYKIISNSIKKTQL